MSLWYLYARLLPPESWYSLKICKQSSNGGIEILLVQILTPWWLNLPGYRLSLSILSILLLYIETDVKPISSMTFNNAEIALIIICRFMVLDACSLSIRAVIERFLSLITLARSRIMPSICGNRAYSANMRAFKIRLFACWKLLNYPFAWWNYRVMYFPYIEALRNIESVTWWRIAFFAIII